MLSYCNKLTVETKGCYLPHREHFVPEDKIMAQEFGPYQLAVNKLLQFAIDRKVANADQIIVDGQLGDQWGVALEAILADHGLRTAFDYGVLREVRDDLIPQFGRFSFVGEIGQSFPDRFEFLKLLGELADAEAKGEPHADVRRRYNRICGWPEHS